MVVALPQCDAPLGYTGRADRTIVERPRPLHKKAERRAVARLGGVEHGTSRSSDGAFEQTERKRTQVNAWEAPSFTPVRFTFSSVAPKHARSERVTATRTTGRDGAYYVLALPGCTVTSRVRVDAQEKKETFGFVRSVTRSLVRQSGPLNHSITQSLTHSGHPLNIRRFGQRGGNGLQRFYAPLPLLCHFCTLNHSITQSLNHSLTRATP